MKLPDLDLSTETRAVLATLMPDGGPDIPDAVIALQAEIVTEALQDPVNTLIAAFQAHVALVASEAKHHAHIMNLVYVIATEAALIEHTWRTKFTVEQASAAVLDGQHGHILKVGRTA
jgi:hypothetical protein